MDLLSSVLIGISCGALTSSINGYLNRRSTLLMVNANLDYFNSILKSNQKTLENLEQKINEVPKYITDREEYISSLEERIIKLEEEKWEFINTAEPLKDQKKGKHGK
jgi:peptidoglycan hydrolase CwlO-like protein